MLMTMCFFKNLISDQTVKNFQQINNICISEKLFHIEQFAIYSTVFNHIASCQVVINTVVAAIISHKVIYLPSGPVPLTRKGIVLICVINLLLTISIGQDHPCEH